MLENFLEYLQFEKRYSDHTLIAYRRDLEMFQEFAVEDILVLDHKDVRNWMVYLLESGMKSSTVNRKLSSLRTFYEWCVSSDYLSSSPMKLVQGPKKEKRLPVFVKQSSLSEERLELHFGENFEGVIDRMLFEVLYQTGVRLSELIGLKWSDVRKDHIRVVGKRNKERIIPVSEDFIVELQNLALEKDRAGYASCEYVFSLKNGKKLYPSLVYRKINHYLSLASDSSKRSPHVLRHTFATHLLNNGAGIEVIKELLGHSGLAATQVYTHNSFAEISKIYSQAHPRGHK